MSVSHPKDIRFRIFSRICFFRKFVVQYYSLNLMKSLHSWYKTSLMTVSVWISCTTWNVFIQWLHTFPFFFISNWLVNQIAHKTDDSLMNWIKKFSMKKRRCVSVNAIIWELYICLLGIQWNDFARRVIQWVFFMLFIWPSVFKTFLIIALNWTGKKLSPRINPSRMNRELVNANMNDSF